MQIYDRLGAGHLRAVVALEQQRSFTAAGQRVGLSQSSLSRKIAEVENTLRTQLFKRTTRSVELTPAGRAIIERMRSTVAAYESGMQALLKHAEGEEGRVVIGCLPSIAATYLPKFIPAFTRKYPDVRLEVRDGLLDQVLDAVRAGEVDFGVTALSSRHPDLMQQRISADQFFCAVPQGHRLSESEQLDWRDLHGEPFIAFSSESSISLPVEAALDAAGAVPGSITGARNIGAVAGLVSSGLGVTAVPGLVRPLMDFAGLRYIPLSPVVKREVCIVRRRGEGISAAAERFTLELERGR